MYAVLLALVTMAVLSGNTEARGLRVRPLIDSLELRTVDIQKLSRSRVALFYLYSQSPTRDLTEKCHEKEIMPFCLAADVCEDLNGHKYFTVHTTELDGTCSQKCVSSRDAAFLTQGATGEGKTNHDLARRQLGEATYECGECPDPNDIEEEEDLCAPDAVPSCSSDHICDYINGHQYYSILFDDGESCTAKCISARDAAFLLETDSKYTCGVCPEPEDEPDETQECVPDTVDPPCAKDMECDWMNARIYYQVQLVSVDTCITKCVVARDAAFLLENGFTCGVCELEATAEELPAPTSAPTTSSPTNTPTDSATTAPTKTETGAPTTSPSAAPTKSPTKVPTEGPSALPTTNPTDSPTDSPTTNPTQSPTAPPTKNPTETPTDEPTINPTETPTAPPTKIPTMAPTNDPTEVPTASPTTNPTEMPTIITEAPTYEAV